jgi:hypothetical protein
MPTKNISRSKSAARVPKYSKRNLIPVFLEAAKLRNRLVALGFTDNGGAIHSAERILGILGTVLKYPGLSHINNYKNYGGRVEFSEAAWHANKKGKPVFIEHVAPIRDFTRRAIDLVSGQKTTSAAIILERYVKRHFRLVLLTMAETRELNKKNRSKMHPKRLEGIKLHKRSTKS